MATATKKRSAKSSKSKSQVRRYIGKPAGVIQQRVETVGPSQFGVVSVDCAKRRSKWMLLDFYGRVLIEPAEVEHNAGCLSAMTSQIKEALVEFSIKDSIAAVEMTGVYHKPVQAALRKAGIDTRTVHPFASKHYRRPLHPDLKTDDHDLEAIFHAAINGYGLATLPVNETYQSLQRLIRHRGNLVKQRGKLQVQIRAMMHQSMPGYDELFALHKFFKESVAMPVAKKFSSAATIKQAGTEGLASLMTDQWTGLLEVWELLTKQISNTEREMAGFLVKTPYVLLLSVTGINGRAGLYPSRYQSNVTRTIAACPHSGRNRKLIRETAIAGSPTVRCGWCFSWLAVDKFGVAKESIVMRFFRSCKRSTANMQQTFVAWWPI